MMKCHICATGFGNKLVSIHPCNLVITAEGCAFTRVDGDVWHPVDHNQEPQKTYEPPIFAEPWSKRKSLDRDLAWGIHVKCPLLKLQNRHVVVFEVHLSLVARFSIAFEAFLEIHPDQALDEVLFGELMDVLLKGKIHHVAVVVDE